MMTTEVQSQYATNQIQIAHLSPTSDNSPSHILAQVALVWPYSSSTGTLALLLADTDIRRRKSKGQVKVIFRYGCAEAVANTKVGIGDTVRLGLAGCTWVETGDAISTPGKKIDWDLQYKNRLVLQVLRTSQDDISVDYTSNKRDVPTTNGVNGHLDGTPNPLSLSNGLSRRQSRTIHVPYLTPQKSSRSTSARTYADIAWKSLVEEDGYVPGHGRKRTKFARNGDAWSLVDTEDEPDRTLEVLQASEEVNKSHSLETAESDWSGQPERPEEDAELQQRTNESQAVKAEHGLAHQEYAVGITDADVPRTVSVMAPPSTPFRPTQLNFSHDDEELPEPSPSSNATTTPRLLPIPSPGLPLVSPMFQRPGVETGYFPVFQNGTSPLDATGDDISVSSEDLAVVSSKIVTTTSLSDSSPIGAVSASAPPGSGDDTGAEQSELDEPVTIIDGHAKEAERASIISSTMSPDLQWFSSFESQLNQAHPQEAQASSQNTPYLLQKPEVIEDDDMYGAPSELPKSRLPPMAENSANPPQSPLDVLEQFLQMSPDASFGPSPAFDSNGAISNISPTSFVQQGTLDSAIPSTQREKISVSTTPKQSPITYPDSQSPFLQHREQQSSSNTSSRPSSTHQLQPRLLDGTVDEQPPFADYIDQLSKLASATMRKQDSIAVVEADQDARQNEDTYEIVKTQMAVSEQGTESGETEIVTQHMDEIEVVAVPPPPKSSEGSAHSVSRHDNQEMPASDPSNAPQLPDALPTVGTPDSLLPQRSSSQSQHERVSEPVLELLPDEAQSKVMVASGLQEDIHEALFVDRQQGTETQNETQPSIEAQMTESSIPPPQGYKLRDVTEQMLPTEPGVSEDSQQDLHSPLLQVEDEDSRQAEPLTEGASDVLLPENQNLPGDVLAPRRSSQRLSARKSNMTTNISSPYFTPHKPALAPPSSPTRKENIRYATPDRTSLPSSPTQAKTKTPTVPTPVQELVQTGAGTLHNSPRPRVKKPTPRRQSGITTPLAYYAALNSLNEHFGQMVDALGICMEASTEPERAKSGPKDYHTTLRLVDTSLTAGENKGVVLQIFRPASSALPTVIDGDVIILRNFKVQTVNNRFMLLSTDTSSWAVFHAKPDSVMSLASVVMSGPPLEYGPAETTEVKLLLSWWKSTTRSQSPQSSAHKQAGLASPQLQRSSPKPKETAKRSMKAMPADIRRSTNETDNFNNEDAVQNFFNSFTNEDSPSIAEDIADEAEDATNTPILAPPRRSANFIVDNDDQTQSVALSPRRSSRRKANRTDHSGNEGDQVSTVIAVERGASAPLTDATNHRRQSIVSAAASESGKSFTPRRSTKQRVKNSPNLVHELRDGTKYVDDEGRNDTLVHELRDGVTYVDD